MGRRKIEIQPITHERNRSVTFLKRKNGLFKKAYELGVLCSVDVAVIIFESKPSNGHHVKLHQYCSTDIHDIVKRHMRHDGEKDSRSPVDFSGGGGARGDDGGDGDEEEADEEEPADPPPVASSARGGNQKRQRTDDKPTGKNTSGLTPDDASHMNVDSDYRPRPTVSATFPPATSSIPLSSDRHRPLRNPSSSSVRPTLTPVSVTIPPTTSHARMQPNDSASAFNDYGSPSSSSGPSAYPRSGYEANGGPPAGNGSFYSSHPSSSYLPPFDFVDHEGHPPSGRPLMSGQSSRYSHHSSRSYPSYHPDYHKGHHTSNHDLLASFLGGPSSSSSDHPRASGLAWPIDSHRHSITPPTASSSGGTTQSSASSNHQGGPGSWLDFLSGTTTSSSSGPPPHMVSGSQSNGARSIADLFPLVSGERTRGGPGKRDGEVRSRELENGFDYGRGRDGAG